jgi:holo-[acyl-carrier protein] synthase
MTRLKSLVYGLGCDVVRMTRLKQIYDRYGLKFLKRAYHPIEIEMFQRITDTDPDDNNETTQQKEVEFLASRWAVKEAATKAFARYRVPFPDMYVTKATPLSTSPPSTVGSLVPFRSNATYPILEFSQNVHSLCEELSIGQIHVSLSHDDEYAYAAVILERGEDGVKDAQKLS